MAIREKVDNPDGSVTIICHYTEPPHEHHFEAGWIFGGANGLHPGADPRWQQTTYTYYDDRAKACYTTQVPLCDDQAIDEFTKVAGYGRNPVWLAADRPDGTVEMLPWVYDKATDSVTERQRDGV